MFQEKVRDICRVIFLLRWGGSIHWTKAAHIKPRLQYAAQTVVFIIIVFNSVNSPCNCPSPLSTILCNLLSKTLNMHVLSMLTGKQQSSLRGRALERALLS